MTEDTQRAEMRFVLALARALHQFGTPADRLEEAMRFMCRKLGIDAEFFSTPTTIIAAFGAPEDTRTAMMRVESGELDMGKLARLDKIADQVAAQELDVTEGMRRLEAIVAAPPTWRKVPTAAAHAVATAAVVVFFHGGPMDVAVAGVLGLAIGVLSLIMARSTAQARVYELVGAALAAFVGGVSAALIDGVSASVVTIAGLLVLLPGLTLTVAIQELSTHNLISGTSRLMAAVIVLLELALGVAVGERAAQALVEIPQTLPAPLPGWADWAAVIASALAMVGVVKAEHRAAPWIVLATLVGFLGARIGTSLLGNELGVMVGAFALGILVNLYARWSKSPAQVVLVPATLILVPGSVGFRGISSLLHRETLTGVETTFGMFVVAMAIVAGLLIANATLSSRRVL